MQQEKPKPLSWFDLIPRRRKIAQTQESTDAGESSDVARKANNASTEVMWLRDLLPWSCPVLALSYKSDWRQDVKSIFESVENNFSMSFISAGRARMSVF